MSEFSVIVRNVSKRYEIFPNSRARILKALLPNIRIASSSKKALIDINFTIKRGEVFGIIGRNGSGKSTLLQIISQILKPTSGNVEIYGLLIPLLELGAGFNPELTGRQNARIYSLVMSGKELKSFDEEEIAKFADIGEYFDLPVKLYSSGMYVRIAFAAAMWLDPDILIVDEALSVGDILFQFKCFEKIKSLVAKGKTIIFVSHSTDQVLRLCDRVVVLESGEIKYIGLPSAAVSIFHELLFSKDKGALAQQKTLEERSFKGEDIVKKNPNYNKDEIRLGKRELEIFNIEIASERGNNLTSFRSAENLVITIHSHSKILQNNLSFGFAITTREGIYVFGTNFYLMQHPLVSVVANQIVTIKFQFNCNLVGDEYLINVGCNKIIAESEEFVDVRRGVLILRISDTPEYRGMVNLSPTVFLDKRMGS